jgi:hypothetical protein
MILIVVVIAMVVIVICFTRSKCVGITPADRVMVTTVLGGFNVHRLMMAIQWGFGYFCVVVHEMVIGFPMTIVRTVTTVRIVPFLVIAN